MKRRREEGNEAAESGAGEQGHASNPADAAPQLGDKEDPKAASIRLLLLRVGEQASRKDSAAAQRLPEHLLRLRSALSKDLEENKPVVCGVLAECGCGLGWKAPIYATLTALMPSDVRANVVTIAVEKLLRALKGQADFPNQVGVVLRFFCELANVKVVDNEEVAQLLVDLTGKESDALSEAVVVALPWFDVLRGLQEEVNLNKSVKEKLNSILANVEDKINSRTWKISSSLIGGSGNVEDGLILRPYSEYQVKDALEENSDENRQISLKTLLLDQLTGVDIDSLAIHSQLFLNISENAAEKIFAQKQNKQVSQQQEQMLEQSDEKAGVVQTYESIHSKLTPEVRWILRQFTEEILHAYFPYFREALAAIREFGITAAHDAHIVVCIMEVLAQRTGNRLFIQRIVAELAKEKNEDGSFRFKDIIEDAVDAVIISLPNLPIDVRDEFCLWFAFHITTLNGWWPWGKWDQIATSLKYSERGIFLKDVLEIASEMLPQEALGSWMTPAFQENMMPPRRTPKSGYLPESGLPPDQGLGAAEVAEFLRGKPEVEELAEWLEKSGACMEPQDLVECLVHGTLLAGQATFTHLGKMIERTKEVLQRQINAANVEPQKVAEFVHGFWITSGHWATVALRLFVEHDLLPATEAAKYVLEKVDPMVMWRYRLLRGLIDDDKTVKDVVRDTLTATTEENAKTRLNVILKGCE